MLASSIQLSHYLNMEKVSVTVMGTRMTGAL